MADKVIIAEFLICMDSNGCKETVANTISNIKGVEKVTKDKEKNMILVLIGKFDPVNVMNKLKRTTLQRVEILSVKEYGKNQEVKEEVAAPSRPNANASSKCSIM